MEIAKHRVCYVISVLMQIYFSWQRADSNQLQIFNGEKRFSLIINNCHKLIAVAKYSNDAAQTRSNRKLTMAPLAAAIRSMCDLGAQLQPAGISCMLVFGEGGKPENPEKNPRSREENQHKLNPLMASGPGIEPGPHWWEASALTTTPSLLPLITLLRINLFS